MNKYQNTKYDHVESDEIKSFWEDALSLLYTNDYDKVVWYEHGHVKDVEEKIDLSVVLLNVNDVDYQIKTKESEHVEHHVFLTIEDFDRYASNNYNVDKIGFGLLKEGYVIICNYNDFIDFWIENNVYLKSELGGNGIYLTFPLRLLRKYDIEFDYVKVRDSMYKEVE